MYSTSSSNYEVFENKYAHKTSNNAGLGGLPAKDSGTIGERARVRRTNGTQHFIYCMSIIPLINYFNNDSPENVVKDLLRLSHKGQ